MGYRILYDNGLSRREGFKSVKPSLSLMTAAFFLLFLILTGIFWPEGSEIIHQMLIPWDPDVTAGAFSGFVTDLQNGAGFADALTAFCQEIIVHGQNLH